MSTAALVAFVLAALVAGLAAPVAAIVLRKRVPLAVFFIAAGFYVVNLLIQQPIFFGVRALHLSGLLVTGLIAPAIYAVCEEVMRYLSFRAGRKMRANRTPDGAVVAGLGHGGAEAFIFTLGMVATVATATLAPQFFVGDANVIRHASPGYFVEFAIDRGLAIVAHVGFAYLTLLAYRRSRWFLPLAIAAHFAVDASVFTLQGLLPADNPLPLVAFALWATFALLLIRTVRRAETTTMQPAAAAG